MILDQTMSNALLVDVTGPAGAAIYDYDPAGRMTERDDDAGTATFTWTARGELDTVEDPITGTTIAYDWDAASQLVEVAYGTGSAPTRALVWDEKSQQEGDS